MAKYIIRLDDACPTFNIEKWQRYFDIFDTYQIKPIIAVIPNNQSDEFINHPPFPHFWDMVRRWNAKGWGIAMHGFNHVYETTHCGIVHSLSHVSEFAGLPYNIQLDKINKAKECFDEYGIKPSLFIAPAHTFDRNTLKALRQATDIRIISDGFALKPFRKYGFNWIPQQSWSFRKRYIGLWTICLHPETAADNEPELLEQFIIANKKKMLDWSNLTYKKINIIDVLFKYTLSFKHKLI